jgi:hypothetical protein
MPCSRHFRVNRPLLIALTVLFQLPASGLELYIGPDLTPHQALAKLRAARTAGDSSPATLLFPAGTTELLTPILPPSRWDLKPSPSKKSECVQSKA